MLFIFIVLSLVVFVWDAAKPWCCFDAPSVNAGILLGGAPEPHPMLGQPGLPSL
jgi:hypothetical protein